MLTLSIHFNVKAMFESLFGTRKAKAKPKTTRKKRSTTRKKATASPKRKTAARKTTTRRKTTTSRGGKKKTLEVMRFTSLGGVKRKKKPTGRKSAAQTKNAARMKQIQARAKKLHTPGGNYAQAVKKAAAELKREGKLI